MQAFSLLNLWRNAGGDSTAVSGGGDSDADISTVQQVSHESTVETDDDESFFDLEFTAPYCDDKEENNARDVNDEDRETKFDFVESPKDVFFGGRIVALEPSSKPQSPISLLRSSRVFMLGFRKSKFQKTEESSVSMATPKHNQKKSLQQGQSKRFTVKCKVKEVPIVPLFTRDNSLRSKTVKQSSSESPPDDSSKRFSKDAIQKYLKLIKPLYVRVSKRYGEKMKFSGQLSTTTPLSSASTAPSCSPIKHPEEKQGSRPAVLRVVGKQLGKSRSASSDAGMMPPPVSRRDDSLLLQHDGIQSAILHCKRSFNSSRGDDPWTKCVEEEKRCSI
ncbi:probable membrane-associated kinase regulator 2 isoform X2 [Cornus florida]|uniref:probable membrane-associated kinase regulator 2 isoform X2 n=1 Tax=Cornus florida TaxID=4283 RepID=UPI00289BB915|nr:probable membrane-associated kinase regulator 2 isoform X2 [Cornus florida]